MAARGHLRPPSIHSWPAALLEGCRTQPSNVIIPIDRELHVQESATVSVLHPTNVAVCGAPYLGWRPTTAAESLVPLGGYPDMMCVLASISISCYCTPWSSCDCPWSVHLLLAGHMSQCLAHPHVVLQGPETCKDCRCATLHLRAWQPDKHAGCCCLAPLLCSYVDVHCLRSSGTSQMGPKAGRWHLSKPKARGCLAPAWRASRRSPRI